ncbi:MAG: Dabb family protein [Alicyclobacillaceae bacterium]|nr:Dabb family protein [Alicyclobacillaceae bacterium]
MLTHIVLMKLKDPSPATTECTLQVLRGLSGRVPQLRHLEAGADVVRSDRSYDIALVTRFDSLADMQAYQVHPAHVEAVEYLRTVLERSVAVDYES